MDAIKGMQRLGWRFSEASKKNNTFEINQKDLDALKGIAKYIEKTQTQQFKDNDAFAKLYILIYAKMINHYKTDMFSSTPRKAIIKLLNRPFEVVFKDFQEQVNDLYVWANLKALGVNLEHPATITDEDKKKNIKVLQKEMTNEDFKSTILDGAYNIDTIKDCLIREVNHALNIIKK